jgi:hypothetical protein
MRGYDRDEPMLPEPRIAAAMRAISGRIAITQGEPKR